MLKHNQRAQTSPALERNCYLLLPVCQARVDTLVSWQRVIAEGSYHWATVACSILYFEGSFLSETPSGCMTQKQSDFPSRSINLIRDRFVRTNIKFRLVCYQGCRRYLIQIMVQSWHCVGGRCGRISFWRHVWDRIFVCGFLSASVLMLYQWAVNGSVWPNDCYCYGPPKC